MAWLRGHAPGSASTSDCIPSSLSLADSRACGPTASKSGPSQRQGAVGQRAQDGQHPPRGHGDLDARPRGSYRGGAGGPVERRWRSRRGGGPGIGSGAALPRSPGPLRRGDSDAGRAAQMAPRRAPQCSQAEKVDPQPCPCL